jgi:hypothetical protein
MTEKADIRADISTETVKALLLINGGGAVALLTVFGNIHGKVCYIELSRPILIGVLILLIGLVSAVMHNLFRVQCSKGRKWACKASWVSVSASILAIIVTGAVVGFLALDTIGKCPKGLAEKNAGLGALAARPAIYEERGR